MKKIRLPLILFSTAFLLGACGAATSSGVSSSSSASSAVSASSGDDSSSSASSASSSSSSPSSSESSSSSSDVRGDYGAFSIVKTVNGSDPVYDALTNTYTLYVTAKKATYTATGLFEGGQIVIADGNGLGVDASGDALYKGVNLILNGAYLGNSSGTVIDYTLDQKNIALYPANGTVNFIVGGGDAVVSENNVEFYNANADLGEAGTLNVISTAGHGVKADEVHLYGNPLINVIGAKDGLHGHQLITDDTGTTPTYFTGTLSVSAVSQALDFSDGDGSADDPYDGSVAIESGANVFVVGATDVVRTDVSLSVAGSLTATDISSDPVITENTGKLAISVTGTFTVNGAAYTTTLL